MLSLQCNHRESIILGTADTIIVDLTDDEIFLLAGCKDARMDKIIEKIIAAHAKRKPIRVTNAGGWKLAFDAPRHLKILRAKLVET